MASSFFSEFGLMWYLGELRKAEFRKFKELLKETPVQLGLQLLPWAEVKKGTREDLANLLSKHYGEEQAWDVTFLIFQKIDRKDLCEKAKKEITGHAKVYRTHVEEKFTNMWFRDSVTRIYDHFEKKLTPKECEYLDCLFAPKETGRRTVVLKGLQGVGKTTILTKLMLSWAEGSVYQKFSYIFYLCCREVKQVTVTSLAALMCRGWSSSLSPAAEITSDPERLLFIVDSFEELGSDLNEPDTDLCSDWTEQRPVRVVLSSLLRKKMLPESSLLIATTPSYPQSIEDRLECPEIRMLRGFHEKERKLYFCCLFQDRNRGAKAFSLVRGNEQLFSMCEIPILCWTVGTCLKQEMEKGRDLAVTCRRITSLYSSFVLNLFTPKGAGRPDRQSQGRLMGLCSLAAEGMWTDTFVFSEEDLRRNGLVGSDIPALLEVAKALRRRRDAENSYSFVHLCVQELCAALFYVVKSPTDHPNPAVASVETLVFVFLSKVKLHWVFLGCFLFGLLSEKEQRKLEAFFGPRLRQQEIRQALARLLQGVSQSERLQGEVDFRTFCYCLFEMENETFVEWAVNLFQEMYLFMHDKLDLVPVAYCLKHCYALRKLCFSTGDVFAQEGPDTSISSSHLACWYHICSVLTTNENLRELEVNRSHLQEPTFVTLSSQLRHPWCRIQKLWINDVSFSGESRLFFEVLTHSPALNYLDLSGTSLSRDNVALLCQALNSSACNIQKLLLANCGLLPEDCEGFRGVLQENTKLRVLNLSFNYLDTGMALLCGGLCHPTCALHSLVLACCYISEDCWGCLPEVLLCNQTLAHLDFSTNILKYENLSLLCEALTQPGCHLKSLCLANCFITTEGCRDLALVFTQNPNLRNLQLSHNDIGDNGVRLLCEALIHPTCRLQILGLGSCGLTSACCEDLASALVSGCSLRRLTLSGNALDHEGVLALCQALRHPQCRLQTLGLRKAEFDEETQELLTDEEQRNPSLEIVDE